MYIGINNIIIIYNTCYNYKLRTTNQGTEHSVTSVSPTNSRLLSFRLFIFTFLHNYYCIGFLSS